MIQESRVKYISPSCPWHAGVPQPRGCHAVERQVPRRWWQRRGRPLRAGGHVCGETRPCQELGHRIPPTVRSVTFKEHGGRRRRRTRSVPVTVVSRTQRELQNPHKRFEASNADFGSPRVLLTAGVTQRPSTTRFRNAAIHFRFLSLNLVAKLSDLPNNVLFSGV